MFHTFISLSRGVSGPVKHHQVQRWPKNQYVGHMMMMMMMMMMDDDDNDDDGGDLVQFFFNSENINAFRNNPPPS